MLGIYYLGNDTHSTQRKTAACVCVWISFFMSLQDMSFHTQGQVQPVHTSILPILLKVVTSMLRDTYTWDGKWLFKILPTDQTESPRPRTLHNNPERHVWKLKINKCLKTQNISWTAKSVVHFLSEVGDFYEIYFETGRCVWALKDTVGRGGAPAEFSE